MICIIDIAIASVGDVIPECSNRGSIFELSTGGFPLIPQAKNVLGGDLKPCCKFPMTGFYRDGYCHTGPEDVGRHVVCVRMTDEFLAFSKQAGNDLSTPHPEYDFPGLIAGDQWCLCAERWQQAFEAGAAPAVVLESTHESALEIIKLQDLKDFAVDDGFKFDG